MARSDLLISLVKAGTSGDQTSARAAAEAIIAEERAKKHNVLADRLTTAMRVNGRTRTAFLGGERKREFLVELRARRRLDDLVLSEPVRQACVELIEEQHRASVLRAHSLEPRHRVLLVGPPGNGKTSLAEAIAESLAVPFFVVRYEAMIGSFLGETASRLKHVFEYVRTTPCVLFFDEFDAVGKERGDIHETGEIKRVVSSLLMQVDDLPSYTVVLAATNHAELLDRAVWRRFQLRLVMEAPNLQAIGCVLRAFCRHLPRTARSDFDDRRTQSSEPISYAEAEEFCLDIRRRSALAMGERKLKDIVTERLDQWASRSRAYMQARRPTDGGVSAAADSREPDRDRATIWPTWRNRNPEVANEAATKGERLRARFPATCRRLLPQSSRLRGTQSKTQSAIAPERALVFEVAGSRRPDSDSGHQSKSGDGSGWATRSWSSTRMQTSPSVTLGAGGKGRTAKIAASEGASIWQCPTLQRWSSS